MANKSGPDLLCDTSHAKSGPATFRNTKIPETAVATASTTHMTISEGIKQSTVAGNNGNMLYPYRQTQSTKYKAFMPMQRVVSQKRVGMAKLQVDKIVRARIR